MYVPDNDVKCYHVKKICTAARNERDCWLSQQMPRVYSHRTYNRDRPRLSEQIKDMESKFILLNRSLKIPKVGLEISTIRACNDNIRRMYTRVYI